MPTTTDDSAPKWRVNPYTGTALSSGTPLPSKSLNTSIYGDKSSSGSYLKHVYVQGKIWKYVMNPFPYVSGTADQNVVVTARVADDVILCVGPTGAFNADVEDPATGYIPGLPTATQKDWLFRFLAPEPSPPYTYGYTDLSVPSVQTWPTANSVALGFTVWLLVQDEQAKGVYKRKVWERVPFRLSH